MNFHLDAPLRRHKKHKRHKKLKPEKPQPSLSIADSSLDATSDTIEIEEELCVVEIPNLSDIPSASDSSIIEMSAAEKLKSQTISPSKFMASTSAASTPIGPTKVIKKKKARRDSGTSSEEERWLDAIESGKLEQVDDELKKIKDPKLMTARQRAMYERTVDKDPNPASETLLALPSGYKEKIMTAEAIQKAQLKSQKRKQMADEKREKDKKKTMDRLLKKQESKVAKVNKNKQVKVPVPVITYRDSINGGATLTFPSLSDLSLSTKHEIEPPKPILCQICNCNLKRYNCSKTNAPLCSFKCYQINLKSITEIMC